MPSCRGLGFSVLLGLGPRGDLKLRHGSFRNFGVPYLGVFIIGIPIIQGAFFRVPYFRKLAHGFSTCYQTLKAQAPTRILRNLLAVNLGLWRLPQGVAPEKTCAESQGSRAAHSSYGWHRPRSKGSPRLPLLLNPSSNHTLMEKSHPRPSCP